MAKRDLVEEIEIPEGVTVTFENDIFNIKGEKGQISKRFVHPNVKASIKDKNIVLESKKAKKREKAVINSYKAHLMNAFAGVLSGHMYKMSICSGHFPMNVTFNNGVLTIKNFYGERVPRKVNISPDVKVKISGKEIVLEGVDKELVGQQAAKIELATRRAGFDRRVFQDGIFIVEKSEKKT